VSGTDDDAGTMSEAEVEQFIRAARGKDAHLGETIHTTAIHSDQLGEWVIVDDDVLSEQVQIIPLSYAHRQVISRDDARLRFGDLAGD
jgi:predicted glycosyltransferase